MNDREILVGKISVLRNELNSLSNDLESLDSKNKLEKNSLLVGKCYKRAKPHENHHEYYLIYDLNKSHDFKAIRISYYDDSDSYFSIEYSSHIDPLNRESHYDTVIEVPREVFDEHFNIVNKIIVNNTNV